MNKSFATAVLALAMSVIAVDLSFAQSQAGRMMGMAGGGCPMMGMMGQGMMGQGMMGQGPMGQGPKGQGRMAGNQEMMGAIAESRLAHLKGELKITDAQTVAWNKLAEAIRKSAASRTERMRGKWSGDEPGKTLVERLEAHEQFMSARLDELKQIKAAWSELYQGLTESQKKEADEIVLPMMGMGGPGMGMRFR